ncbi:hypothetical protein [Borrelia duttonii]|uniref:Uncharacterized protein n=1 Tax=Borrelia duttonii (strain Ly) TaxID=412419 RepID=B5RPB3_BORDL|nr:hypothetical protein BDU_2022 [Borrelia duttonii Ly]
MIKVGTIQLYKLGEVVKILKENFNFTIDNPTLCRKASKLNAYVIYNEKKYIPKDIIYHLTANMRYLETKINTQKIIENKIESIKQDISTYDKKHKINPLTAIQRIKTNNNNTTTFIKAFLELTEEIKNIKEETQKEIKNIKEETQKEIKNIKEETQKEIKNKDEEIFTLKQIIQNIQKQTQINLNKELISTINNPIYKKSKNNFYITNKKNI